MDRLARSLKTLIATAETLERQGVGLMSLTESIDTTTPGGMLIYLRRRLSLLPPRDPARADVVARAAQAYGISESTVCRSLRELTRPKPVRRADHGMTKAAPQAEMERYAEIAAALKVRTSNKKGHRLSTRRAISPKPRSGLRLSCWRTPGSRRPTGWCGRPKGC